MRMPERRLFCPVCGRGTELLIEGLCPECFVKHHPMIELKKASVDIKICKKCGRLGYKKVWSDSEEELVNVLMKDLKYLVKPTGEIRSILLKPFLRRGFLQLTVVGKAHPALMQDYQEGYEIPVKLLYTICDACLGKISRSKRAIVQVRADKRELTVQEKNTVVEVLKRTGTIKNKGIDLSPWEVKEEAGGIDLYFSSIRAAREFISTLSNKIYFDVLETGKKLGVDSSGQEKIQVTFRLLLPEFCKGDIIMYKGRYYLVKEMDSKNVHLLNLDSFVTETQKLLKSFVSQTSTVARFSEIRKGIIIAIENEKVYVMDSDYRIHEVRASRARENFRLEEEIGIVFKGDKILLVPLK
jgi:nonsense-mediated mRNA decay protein 3